MSSTSGSTVASGKPRTRQRAFKAPPTLEVPDIDEDAPERKRVLNVLAQRRYRERKRANRLKANGPTDDKTASNDNSSKGSPSQSIETVSQSTGVLDSESTLPLQGDTTAFDLGSWDPLNDVAMPSILPEPNSGLFPDLSSNNVSGEDDLFFSSMPNTTNPGLSDNLTIRSFSPSSLENATLASSSASESGFPDSYLLPVHELTTLRAILRIAERLGCANQFWSLEAPSPFVAGTGTPIDQLPAALRPTTTQILIPHHPILDLMPWAPVRDKIINLFSLPDEARPPNAAGPMALVNFAYDLEDNAEGVRIYGADPFDANCWEVGQVFFERWWFLFDRQIIETSNRWRQLRGAPPLLFTAGGSPSST